MAKNLNIPQKDIKDVFHEAGEILKDIYGLDLCELTDTKSSKQYIAFSIISPVTPLQMYPEQRNETKMLFIILSYIFMKSGEVQEGKE